MFGIVVARKQSLRQAVRTVTLGHSALTVAILAQGTTSADAGTQASICMGG